MSTKERSQPKPSNTKAWVQARAIENARKTKSGVTAHVFEIRSAERAGPSRRKNEDSTAQARTF